MNDTRVKKWLVISIILLFIGNTVMSTINRTTIKASDDNNTVEVTTQTCGIKGYRDTTVELTRQQYQNLEQYLVNFRARLNQTSTREEAAPNFKDAVVELNKYGLLPKGMSVEKAQRFVTGQIQNLIVKNIVRKSQKDSNFNGIDNYDCSVFGKFSTGETHPWGVFGFFKFLIPHFLPFQLYGPVTFGRVCDIEGGYYYFPAQGWMTAIGSNGLTQISGRMFGTLGHLYSPPMAMTINMYNIGMDSFTGLTIILQGELILSGYSSHIGLAEYRSI